MAARFDCFGKLIVKEGKRKPRSSKCLHSNWYNKNKGYKARIHGWR